MTRLPRMRPRFRIPVPGDGSAVLEQLGRKLAAPDASLAGQVVRCHAFLQMPRDRRSLLSPFLNLELDDGPDGTCLVGRFSPAPNVWTGFMALYIFLGLLGFAGLILGWAQTTVDEFPWGFFAFPGSLALIAFVYGAAFIGQGLSADQMYELRAFVDRAVEKSG
ncbi:MAG: hypothetical protein ABFS42_06040 [Candidatus Krumholzibacteriota bacterium]